MKGQDTFASTWHSDLRESELPNAEARKAACPSSLRSGAMKVQLGFLPSKTLLEQETETHDTAAAAEDNVMPLSIPAASQD